MNEYPDFKSAIKIIVLSKVNNSDDHIISEQVYKLKELLNAKHICTYSTNNNVSVQVVFDTAARESKLQEIAQKAEKQRLFKSQKVEDDKTTLLNNEPVGLIKRLFYCFH